MKVTRIATGKNLNAGKYAALQEQARRLGTIRSEVWQGYGSIEGLHRGDRSIRDEWLVGGRTFAVCANAWKETLRDAKADIAMSVEAAKVKVRRAIRARSGNQGERKRLYTLLKSNIFTEDTWLRRKMRKHWRRGHNHTHNQIIVRSDNYTTFQLRRGGIAGGRERRAQRAGKIVRSRDRSLDTFSKGQVHLAGTDRATAVGTAQPGLQLQALRPINGERNA